MHLPAFALLSLAALSVALPTTTTLQSRQAGILKATTFNAISISGGKAGNAKAEAAAKFSALNLNNLKSVSRTDINFLDKVNQVANDAEAKAFNPAVAAASGASAHQLRNGKTKNKILKLTAAVIKLKAQQAQGQNVAAKLAQESKKLDNNVAIDVKNSGQASTSVPFDAAISA